MPDPGPRIPTESGIQNPARQVGRRAGIAHDVPAYTINKAGASGLPAVASAAQAIALGDAESVLAGGMESMSRMSHLIDPGALCASGGIGMAMAVERIG